jgi:hypothetical protein
MSDDRDDGGLREVRQRVMSKTYDAIISGAGSSARASSGDPRSASRMTDGQHGGAGLTDP